MMEIQDLKNLFEAALQNKVYLAKDRTICPPPIPAGYLHSVYSYAALPELINELQAIEPDRFDDEFDQLDRFAVRYVVDHTGTIWFAKEGPSGKKVPDHVQMEKTCLSAGNIYFALDYQSIARLTNKSGHFKPAAGTMVWAIAALVSLNASFAASVRIEIYNNASLTPEEAIVLPGEDLSQLLPNAEFPSSDARFEIQQYSENGFECLSAPQEKNAAAPIKKRTHSKFCFNLVEISDENHDSSHDANTSSSRGRFSLFYCDDDETTSSSPHTAPSTPPR